MRVLVVGSGAREHALAWKLAGEGHEVVCAPGNGGTPRRVGAAADDLDGLAQAACDLRVDLSIVGPEAPLAAGLVDLFADRQLKAFGPTRAAARLESSKAWTKAFLQRHGLPTARAEVAETNAEVRRQASRLGFPVVLKADGLAAGKGVWIARNAPEVEDALAARQALGQAGARLLVEEHLEGVELSVLAFTDGHSLAVMPPARDYKRVGDRDTGPNTGGMGGYTWPSYATPDLLAEVEATILRPTIQAMAAEGQPYRGVLYAGLMLTAHGPRVLEFNARFGDPEAQLILPLLDSSLLEVCLAVIEGRLDEARPRWQQAVTCGVVLAAPGYPERPQLGTPISGLDRLPPDILALHAGTALKRAPAPPAVGSSASLPSDERATGTPTLGASPGRKERPAGPPAGWPARRDAPRLVTSGGRVVTLVAAADSLEAARARVYAAAPLVRFEGMHYRSDIGAGALVGV
jgi:phosphoribosylamine---glycine ligase